MDDHTLMQLVRTADPLAGAADSGDGAAEDALLAKILRGERPPQKRWRWPTRRAVAMAGVALAAIALATPAFGISRLLRLLGGTPAPPAITEEIGGRPAEQMVELRTADGYIAGLYTLSMNDRKCTYVRVSRSGAGDPVYRGVALCPRVARSGGAIDYVTTSASRLGGTWTRFVYGHVSAAVASVEIHLADGSHTTAPLSDGYFLYEEAGSPPSSAMALDAAGKALDRRPLEAVPTGP